MCEEARIHYIFHQGFLTWFFKFFIKYPPCLSDPLQALLHGLDVHIGAVALREFGVTVAPAVVVPADELTLSIARDVAESCQHETFSQVVWKDHL